MQSVFRVYTALCRWWIFLKNKKKSVILSKTNFNWFLTKTNHKMINKKQKRLLVYSQLKNNKNQFIGNILHMENTKDKDRIMETHWTQVASLIYNYINQRVIKKNWIGKDSCWYLEFLDQLIILFDSEISSDKFGLFLHWK